MKPAALLLLWAALVRSAAAFRARAARCGISRCLYGGRSSPALSAEDSASPAQLTTTNAPLKLKFTPRADARLVQLITPPPNLTGDLHVGNALNLVCSDVYLRHAELTQRMVYARFGSDHAGHGLERIINRRLGVDRPPGERVREAMRHCESVKASHVETIRSLGVDWLYDCWTLGSRSKQVTREAFVSLCREGHISERLYPTFAKLTDQGVVFLDAADVRVVEGPVEVYVSTLKVVGGPGTVDPTKPGPAAPCEGMTTGRVENANGDDTVTVYTSVPGLLHATAAVAVGGEEYQRLGGGMAVLPGSDRCVPIIPSGRASADGATLVIPGYSHEDFQLAWKHRLEVVDITDRQGRLKNVPSDLSGLTLQEAAKHALAFFNHYSTVQGAVPTLISDESCQVLVVPAPHWLLDVGVIAQPALEALGRLDVDPPSRIAFLRQRLESTQPWCVSRNGWWGLRVPVWYLRKDGATVALPATSSEEAENLASEKLGRPLADARKDGYTLEQDSRTLDTWFSSALWPIISRPDPNVINQLFTGEVPDAGGNKSPEVKTKKVLYTCYDILHSWVARMLMLCPWFNGGELPFDRLVLHGLVQDSQGKKMSKSHGNTITAEEFVRRFGPLNGFADLTQPSALDELIARVTGRKVNNVDPLAVAQARLTLATAASKANVCHDIDAYGGRVKALLKKFAQITNYMAGVCEKEKVTRMWDLQQADEGAVRLVETAIDAALARAGRAVGDCIEQFEFRKAFENIEKYVAVVSHYAIPSHRHGDYGVAALSRRYRDLVRVVTPFAPQLTHSMRLPLGLRETGELMEWPRFGPADPEAEGAFDAIDSAVRQLRRQALEGAQEANVAVPQAYAAVLEAHKPLLAYLLKLTRTAQLQPLLSERQLEVAAGRPGNPLAPVAVVRVRAPLGVVLLDVGREHVRDQGVKRALELLVPVEVDRAALAVLQHPDGALLVHGPPPAVGRPHDVAVLEVGRVRVVQHVVGRGGRVVARERNRVLRRDLRGVRCRGVVEGSALGDPADRLGVLRVGGEAHGVGEQVEGRAQATRANDGSRLSGPVCLLHSLFYDRFEVRRDVHVAPADDPGDLLQVEVHDGANLQQPHRHAHRAEALGPDEQPLAQPLRVLVGVEREDQLQLVAAEGHLRLRPLEPDEVHVRHVDHVGQDEPVVDGNQLVPRVPRRQRLAVVAALAQVHHHDVAVVAIEVADPQVEDADAMHVAHWEEAGVVVAAGLLAVHELLQGARLPLGPGVDIFDEALVAGVLKRGVARLDHGGVGHAADPAIGRVEQIGGHLPAGALAGEHAGPKPLLVQLPFVATGIAGRKRLFVDGLEDCAALAVLVVEQQRTCAIHRQLRLDVALQRQRYLVDDALHVPRRLDARPPNPGARVLLAHGPEQPVLGLALPHVRLHRAVVGQLHPLVVDPQVADPRARREVELLD
ncbi:Valine--tRNA ligase [Babesia caballi]|uniref:valine--tRNA ligase n=1 Tax=Babesia caballi TaxID=5871 RepID=A0AAV4LME7_BABCB|nr:Valine--tRNA ligase [Babesia caballi]